MLDDAARRGCKELLVLTGEKPEANRDVEALLVEYGHHDFTSYVVWACERGLERGLLPHSNLGVLDRGELARLREVNASMGLMLESSSTRLMETVHAGSPTKHPARRLETIDAAGELRIPFTSGILVGIGETEEERMESLDALAGVHARHGHLQELIVQNFVPHPSYYGREVAGIAEEAARRRWSADGGGEGQVVTGDAPLPEWATPITVDDMRRLVRECRRLMPDVAVQIPPNLSDWWVPLVHEGATDLGGLSANGDHISPEHPFPSPHQVRKELRAEGYALTERLCVYPQFIDQSWVSQGVLDVIKQRYWSFIPRKGSGRRRDVTIPDSAAPRAIEKARDNRSLTKEELTALFAERRPAVIEDMRAAADELRRRLAGDTVTFVVNRNINFTNICQVGCAFCGFGQGKRSPDAYEVAEEDFVAKIQEAISFGVSEICMQGGIHPEYTLDDYGRWLRLVKQVAPTCTCTRTRPWRCTSCASARARRPRRFSIT